MKDFNFQIFAIRAKQVGEGRVRRMFSIHELARRSLCFVTRSTDRTYD